MCKGGTFVAKIAYFLASLGALCLWNIVDVCMQLFLAYMVPLSSLRTHGSGKQKHLYGFAVSHSSAVIYEHADHVTGGGHVV